jgi:hypothetical protein
MSYHHEDLQNAINASLGRPARGYGVPAPIPTGSSPAFDLTGATIVNVPEADISRVHSGITPNVPYKAIHLARSPVWINPPGTAPMFAPPSTSPKFAAAPSSNSNYPIYPIYQAAPRSPSKSSYSSRSISTMGRANASGGGHGPRKTCAICQEDLPASQCARLLPCHHDDFCANCIRSLCASGTARNCPMCRAPFTQFYTPEGIFYA